MAPPDPQPPTPPVTVVVATRDRPGFLHGALRAIGLSLRPVDAVVVVDSASRQAAAVRAVAEAAGARLLRCDQPGTCRARNLGWRSATTELVAFTDDDCLPASDWVPAAAAAMAGRPDVEFVTGQVLPAAALTGRAQLGISLLISGTSARFTAGDDAGRVGHGANMVWHRDTLDRLGGFDEQLGPGAPLRAAEDHDLFWRCLRSGGSGAFDPAVQVSHRPWRNRRRQLAAYFGYGTGTGALIVKQRRMELGGPAPAAPPVDARELAATGWLVVSRQVGPSIRRCLADRYVMGAAGETVKLAGTVRGAWSCRHLPLVDGHYCSPA